MAAVTICSDFAALKDKVCHCFHCFPIYLPWSDVYTAKWKWSHLVVSDSLRPVDCSPPSSSIHGILQARILEWVAISFSKVMAKLNLFTTCHYTKSTFRIYSLVSFQVCPTVLLSTMLYFMSAWLILWWQVCISWPPSPILFTPQSSPLVCYIWSLLCWIMFPLYPLCWGVTNGCYLFIM